MARESSADFFLLRGRVGEYYFVLLQKTVIHDDGERENAVWAVVQCL